VNVLSEQSANDVARSVTEESKTSIRKHPETTAFAYNVERGKIYIKKCCDIDVLISELNNIKIDEKDLVDHITYYEDLDTGPQLIVEPKEPYSFNPDILDDTFKDSVSFSEGAHLGVYDQKGIFVANGPSSYNIYDGKIKIEDISSTILDEFDFSPSIFDVY
jgi:hypothetical protein